MALTSAIPVASFYRIICMLIPKMALDSAVIVTKIGEVRLLTKRRVVP